MDSIELTSYGDKELRVVKFSLPAGDACLPVFVIHYRSGKREFVKICPAVGLHAEQARMLAYHFSAYNQWKREDNFLIERRHLSRLVETVPGITPAYYYLWPGKELASPAGDRIRINGEEIQQVPDDAEDFLEFVHQRRAIDRNVLRLAWSAVSKEAVMWMLKKKKPINLGFVKLHAFPMRVNWKEILLARFPNAAWWFKHNVNKAGGFEDRMKEAEFLTELARVEMLALHGRDHHIWWTMEAVPDKSWEEGVREMEMMAKASIGNTAYVRRYEKLVVDLSGRILEVLAVWLEKMCRPFAEICGGLSNGGEKMVPYRGKRNVIPRIGGGIPVRVMVSNEPKRIGAEDHIVTVSKKALGLSTVPDFLQERNAVRRSNEQGDVVKSKDDEERTSRLPLSNVSQGGYAGESVLVESEEQRNDGVDKGIDK